MGLEQILIYAVEIVGAATLIFRGLEKLAAMTNSEKDDMIVKKVLNFLVKATEVVSLNQKK